MVMSSGPCRDQLYCAESRGYHGLSGRERSECAALAGICLLVGIASLFWVSEHVTPKVRATPLSILRLVQVRLPDAAPSLRSPPARKGGRPKGGARGEQKHRPPVHVDMLPQHSFSDLVATPLAIAKPTLPATRADMLSALSDGGYHGQGDGDGSGSGSGNGKGGGTVSGPSFAAAQWIREPTSSDFAREWPPSARFLLNPVRVLLACHISIDNKPRHCQVLQERPALFGFGAAAIRLVEDSRIRGVLKDGSPTDLPVLVPLTFMPFSKGISNGPGGTIPPG
jgi:hypothetical protein